MTAQPVDSGDINARVSRNVKALAAIRGIGTHKELAAAAGLSDDTVSRRLAGKPWKLIELLAMAHALDVDLTVLVEGNPDEWFRRGGTQPPPPKVTQAKVVPGQRRGKSRVSRKSASVRSSTLVAA